MINNIIIICDYAHIVGGIENVAFPSAKRLVEKGFNVYLFAARGPIDKTLIDAGVNVICLNQFDILSNPNRLAATVQGLYNFKAYKQLKRFMKGFSPVDTIIHFHSWSKALSASVFLASARYKFKIVITLHDYFIVCPNGGLYNYQTRKICDIPPLSRKCIYCNCDVRSYPQKIFRVLRLCFQKYFMFKNVNINIVYISNQTRDAVLPYIKNKIKQYFYLKNPILTNGKEFVDISKNDIYLFIARLSQEKGAELFCQALTDLNLKGCVLGDGYLKDKLMKKYPNITFVGWVSGMEKESLVKKGKGLIFPSLWYEGAPLTILEMKAYGIPCIVPDRCAASEEIEDGVTGYVFKTGNLESLKDAILKYENSNIKCLQQNILSNFNLNDYLIDTHVTHLVEIYETIMAK